MVETDAEQQNKYTCWKVIAATAKRKLEHRGEGMHRKREWRKRGTLTFLTLLGVGGLTPSTGMLLC